VSAIVKNFGSKKPLPLYFSNHDMREGGDAAGVVIKDKARPLFYMHQDYLCVSFPSAPREDAKAAKKSGKTKK
jgi:hypothetical protein